ncbi:MAG: helix-turn-helix domain-containing protein [Oscillatoria princeps RMCB-10]|jgi:hypothetical protein|nr:helix-turn-helix domain-containing protein [Oscillatoria princeps RMCB-10]
MASIDEQFAQAANYWDLETLYTDLASAKGKRLTPVEKLHLRGLLCGHSPAEIAEKLGKSVKGVEVELCNTLYQYVKNLVGKRDEKVDNWRNICEWLQEAGYKAQPPAQSQARNFFPESSVVNITNISIDNKQLVIIINLRIPISPASEPPKEDLNSNGLTDI